MPSNDPVNRSSDPELITSLRGRFPNEVTIHLDNKILQGKYEHGPSGFSPIEITEGSPVAVTATLLCNLLGLKESEQAICAASAIKVHAKRESRMKSEHADLTKIISVNEDGDIVLARNIGVGNQIVFLANEMVSGNNVLPVNDKMYNENFLKNHPYLWEKGLALCSDAKGLALCEIDARSYSAEPLPLIGSYADLKVMAAQAISSLFLTRIVERESPDPNGRLANLLRQYL